MNCINFRKNGGFYCVYGDDTYILNYFFGYKIVDNKVGFPVAVIGKVTNTLDSNHISYVLNEEKFLYKKNNYVKFVEAGKKKFDYNFRVEQVIHKLNKLDETNIEEILTFIEAKL